MSGLGWSFSVVMICLLLSLGWIVVSFLVCVVYWVVGYFFGCVIVIY